MTQATPSSTDEKADLASEYGFLWLMRWLERHADGKPRIGQNQRVREDIVALGQDPYIGFAKSDLSEVDLTKSTASVRPRFMGFFGPFGALPMASTREAEFWKRNGDSSFVRFADIFVSRFIQLFYRSWSDARPITQFDHPDGGTFPDQLRAITGDAGPAFANRGAVHDTVRLRYTPLMHGRVKSPTKLSEIVSLHFSLQVRVEEFVVSWLEFASEDLSRVGQQSMGLGQSVRLGGRTASIGEKIKLHLECRDLEQYRSLLPGRKGHAELLDLVQSYVGLTIDVDVVLWIPREAIVPMQLGKDTELGWMSAIPGPTSDEENCQPVKACQFLLAAA